MEYAYPHDYFDETGITYHHGMSLRDWFAGQALAGWMTSEDVPCDERIAERCYQIADAMLAARSAK